MLRPTDLVRPCGVGAVSATDTADRGEQRSALEARSSPMLVVVGAGIQWAAQTTTAAQRAIQTADRVLYAVTDPWAARWIASLNANSESFRYPRDGRPRTAIYADMVEHLLELLEQGRNVCAVFYGSPAWLTRPAHLALQRARELGYRAQMLPGVSAIECLLAELSIDPGEHGLQVYEATAFMRRRSVYNPHAHLVLCQIGVMAQHVSLPELPREAITSGLRCLQRQLELCYPPDHLVVLYEAASNPLERSRVERHRVEMLCDATPSSLSTLYVPPLPQPTSTETRPFGG